MYKVLLFKFRRHLCKGSIKHSRQCLTTFRNTSKFVKNTPLRVIFSTHFSVFENMVKHGLSCLIYHLNKSKRPESHEGSFAREGRVRGG